MRKIVCFVVALLILLCSVSAYNGDVTVYVTDTGSKYHQSWCSYLKSSNPISLEDAINQGYTPCSRCGPPYLQLSPSSPSASSGNPSGTFVRIAPTAPVTDNRYAQLERELEEAKQNAANWESEYKREVSVKDAVLEAARGRANKAETELKNAKNDLERAQNEVESVRAELDSLKNKLQIWGACGVVIGVPVMIFSIWQICWKRAKAEFERLVEAEVLKRLAVQTAEQSSSKANPTQPLQYTRPAPQPDPPRAPTPPKQNMACNVGDENPYLREAYKQRYEGKSLSESAGVPKRCGVKFDSKGYPHRKNALQVDEFTVYITKKGKSYHTPDCPSGSRGKPVNICEARAMGRSPCERCNPISELPTWIAEYQRILRIRDIFGIDMLP